MERPQRLARKQEHRSAEFYGARLVMKSGSGDSKGDAETDDEVFEFKHTQQKGFRLALADWVRHKTVGIMTGKRPVWEVEYTKPDGSWPHYLVVVDRDDYLTMRDELAELREEVAQQAKVLASDWLKGR